MSATFRAEGNRIDHTPVAAVTAGDVVVQNGWVCVATRDIAAGALGSLACEGILDFDKEEVAFAVGEDVYYDEDTGLAFHGAGAYAGKCAAAALATDATVRVKLFAQEEASSGTATGTGTGVE